MKLYINKKYKQIMDSYEIYTVNGDTFIIGEKLVKNGSEILKYNSFAPKKLYYFKFNKYNEVGLFLDSLEKLSVETSWIDLKDYEEVK